ncbi:hypothetical protein ACJJTC_008948 [Scirpophaga incertulas]
MGFFGLHYDIALWAEQMHLFNFNSNVDVLLLCLGCIAVAAATEPQAKEPEGAEAARIIDEVYSPDYYEPTIILDFRYLKSGGRQYVRGPGGQVLILPRHVQSPDHSEHRDYDSLIEHLRLRRMARSRGAEHPHQSHYTHQSQLQAALY